MHALLKEAAVLGTGTSEIGRPSLVPSNTACPLPYVQEASSCHVQFLRKFTPPSVPLQQVHPFRRLQVWGGAVSLPRPPVRVPCAVHGAAGAARRVAESNFAQVGGAWLTHCPQAPDAGDHSWRAARPARGVQQSRRRRWAL
eukprot:364360-Chlamydomonas_euryale.AAC.9